MLQQHIELISTPKDIETLSQELLKSDKIAIDTEFIREKTYYPIVALIQVATLTDVWLIDPLALSKTDLEPFFEVLKSPNVLKIFHAIQADQECFYTSYGFLVRNVFDTAIGASLCGYGDSVGLSKLMSEELRINIKKGHARTDWRVRPLPKQLAHYAMADVDHLVELAESLFSSLDKRHRREWAMELCSKMEEEDAYRSNPSNVAERLAKNKKIDPRSYGVFLELIAWRERRAQRLDIPRRRVVADSVLFDLAKVKPEDFKHLSAFRGIPKGELHNSGQEILDAIKKVKAMSDRELPVAPKSDSARPEEARALELLQCFLKTEADRHRIALKHLIASDQLIRMLRNEMNNKSDLVSQGILTQGAANLIGDELIAMLKGEYSLSLKGSSVEITPIAART